MLTVYPKLLSNLITSKDNSSIQVNQMKNILTTLTLSMSALIATSAMAAPHDYHRNDHNRYQQSHKYDNRWNNNNHYDNRVNSSQRWRSGQHFPTQFNSSRYHVNYKNHHQLPKPGRYQQWYKVNGNYVLVNERNNRIIRQHFKN